MISSTALSALSLVIAVGIDALLGDPPNRFHPVAWLGSLIAYAKKIAPVRGKVWPFLYGTAFMLVMVSFLTCIGFAFEWTLLLCPWWIALVLKGMIATCLFSSRSLASSAAMVQVALEQRDSEQAKHHLSWNLVSRDVSNLSDSQIAAATIESVSENASDSVIAPFFYYAIAGLPGMLVYRFVNTADAMLGYRTKQLEWLGKFAARFDDVLNWIPSRITAVLLLVASRWPRLPTRTSFEVWLRDHSKTASPNSGHPMSAAAGSLGVELEKVDHYVLGGGLAKPDAQSIAESIRLLWRVTWSGLIGALALVTFVQLLSKIFT